MSGQLARELQQVRARYRTRSLDVSTVTWTYLSGGNGAETLLLLPGGPGRAETSFQYIAAFERHYRIIAPDYPAGIGTVAGIVEGLVAILDAERVEQAHLVGGSYSGLIAQCLAFEHSSRVGALMLLDTGLPRPERARRHRLYRALIALLPMALIRAVLWAGTYVYVHEVGADRGFWRAYIHQLALALSRADLLSRLDVWIDFDRNYVFDRRFNEHERAVLIVETDRDPLFRPRERTALRAMYPMAETYLFEGSGHAASLARSAEYIAVLVAFLSRHASGAEHIDQAEGKSNDHITTAGN